MNIVKELRKARGIQQKELAISIGVSRPTVSEWEANKKDPSGDRLRKLAEFFEVDELTILGKGVVDLTQETEAPHTPEARAVSFAMDNLPKEQRDMILNIVKAMFPNKPELFERKGDDDES